MVDVIEHETDATSGASDVEAASDAATATASVDEAAPTSDDVVATDDRLLGELSARAEGLRLTGAEGLLTRLTKAVLEGALEGEMDAHLGYVKHDPAGRDGGNSRNGHRTKTVLTDTGPVDIVPRDRDGSFTPAIVPKRARRLSGLDDLVISLSAKGLTHGEICAHLAEVTTRMCPSRPSRPSPNASPTGWPRGSSGH